MGSKVNEEHKLLIKVIINTIKIPHSSPLSLNVSFTKIKHKEFIPLDDNDPGDVGYVMDTSSEILGLEQLE